MGSRQVEQARMVVTLYDSGRRVVNVDFTYRRPSTLSHEARAASDVAFTYKPRVFSHESLALVD